MDKTLLKKDTIFNNENIMLYMWDIGENDINETVEAVTSAYPVLDYVVKGNFIYVATHNANINESMFDLETAYTYCINTFNKSEPYFETEIGNKNTIVDKNIFLVLPMGTDVFDLQPKTIKDFKEHVVDHIEYFMGQRDEELFDKLFEQLYNNTNYESKM
tara:strand:+ start:7538 stop:8017 length:480 start_codon:yes stop_codon:yes gene_type:complete